MKRDSGIILVEIYGCLFSNHILENYMQDPALLLFRLQSAFLLILQNYTIDLLTSYFDLKRFLNSNFVTKQTTNTVSLF